jgi:hypothetical protein
MKMTIARLQKVLARNAQIFAEEGDLARANAALEVIAMIKNEGYEEIKGKIDFSDEVAA